MADDVRAAIDRRAREDTTTLDEARRARSARTPDMNNPFRAEATRAPRARSWRDPVGQDATGAANAADKNGAIARAREARRTELENQR